MSQSASKTVTAPLTAGTVKWFNPDKGYGFITTDDFRDVYAHISQVRDECVEPRKGDRVTFVEDIGRDGRPYARRVAIVKQPERDSGEAREAPIVPSPVSHL